MPSQSAEKPRRPPGHASLFSSREADVPTERQARILAFIEGHVATYGRPPTLREIGLKFGIRSTNGVNDHLRALVRKGLITREPLKSRALAVVGRPGQDTWEGLPPAARERVVSWMRHGGATPPRAFLEAAIERLEGGR